MGENLKKEKAELLVKMQERWSLTEDVLKGSCVESKRDLVDFVQRSEERLLDLHRQLIFCQQQVSAPSSGKLSERVFQI